MEGLRQRFQGLVEAGKIIYYESIAYPRKWNNLHVNIRFCPGLALKKPSTTPTMPTTTTTNTTTNKSTTATLPQSINNSVNPENYNINNDDHNNILTNISKLPRHNPFLPPELELVISSAGPYHTLIWNKFAVIPIHILIISRDYIPQDSPLEQIDFEACRTVLAAYDNDDDDDARSTDKGIEWLFFYNSGSQSGASQPHRHLQAIPIQSRSAPLLEEVSYPSYALSPLIYSSLLSTRQGGPSQWFEAYQQCKAKLDQEIPHSIDLSTSSYNLLFTKNWMLMVPRGKEFYSGISFNALAMLGYLLAQNEQELDNFCHHMSLNDLYKTIGIARTIN